jgi:dolichyl-phosphate-mannose-protein mannosyltransferase
MAAQSSPKRSGKGAQSAEPPKPKDYGSHGVKDNDVFLLPSSDYQLLGALTVLALAVRLYKIYQPSSVVFDEVQ